MTNPPPLMCHKGHPRTPENTIVLARGESRCRVCHSITQARYRARKGQKRRIQPRLPLAPLLELVTPSAADRAGQQVGAGTVAKQCGTTLTIARRWMRCGIGLDEADAAAIALGMHPCEVWPEWWEVAA